MHSNEATAQPHVHDRHTRSGRGLCESLGASDTTLQILGSSGRLFTGFAAILMASVLVASTTPAVALLIEQPMMFVCLALDWSVRSAGQGITR